MSSAMVSTEGAFVGAPSPRKWNASEAAPQSHKACCAQPLRIIPGAAQRRTRNPDALSVGAWPLHHGLAPSARPGMSNLLDQAVESVRRLHPATQDEIAHVMKLLAGDDELPPVSLTPEERATIARSKRVRRG